MAALHRWCRRIFVVGNVSSHNFGVRYGRATAGTIDVDLRAGKTDRWHAALDVNPIHVGVEVEGPLPPRHAQTQQPSGSILLGLRRSYVDAGLAFVGAVLGDPPGLRFVNAPVYWDYQEAVLKYALAGGTLRVMVLGADDQISLKFARPQDVDPSVNGTFATHILFHRLQLRYQRQFSGWDVLFQSTSGYTQTDLDLGRTVSMSVKTLGNDFRVEASRQITPQYRLFFGTDVQTSYVWLSAAVPSPVREGEFQKPPGSLSQVVAQAEAYFVNPALYAELSAQLHPRVSVVSGVRFDYFGYLRRYSIDPRLSGKVVLTPITQLKWGAGLYSQDPQCRTTFHRLGIGSCGLNAQCICLWRSNKRSGKDWFWSLPGFTNTCGILPEHRRCRGVLVVGKIRSSCSLNGLLRRFMDAFSVARCSCGRACRSTFGWVSYSLLRSERADCPSCSYRLFDFDQTHILIVAAHAYLPYKFEIGLRFRYISGIPQTPVRGGFFDSDTDLYQPIPASERNTDRLAPFHQRSAN